MFGNTRDWITKEILKMKIEGSSFLTSDNTTKLQLSKQYGTGTKNRNIDQWKQVRNPRNKPKHLWSINLWHSRKEHKVEESHFNKWYWENWKAACNRLKIEHYLTPYTKINSKWMKDLNIHSDTIKLLVENIGRTLFNINQSKILFDPPPRIKTIKTQVKQQI